MPHPLNALILASTTTQSKWVQGDGRG